MPSQQSHKEHDSDNLGVIGVPRQHVGAGRVRMQRDGGGGMRTQARRRLAVCDPLMQVSSTRQIDTRPCAPALE